MIIYCLKRIATERVRASVEVATVTVRVYKRVKGRVSNLCSKALYPLQVRCWTDEGSHDFLGLSCEAHPGRERPGGWSFFFYERTRMLGKLRHAGELLVHLQRHWTAIVFENRATEEQGGRCCAEGVRVTPRCCRRQGGHVRRERNTAPPPGGSRVNSLRGVFSAALRLTF